MEKEEGVLNNSILKSAWFKYLNNNTEQEITVIELDASGTRPPKPYLGFKFIAGPTPKGSFDNLLLKDRDNNVYELSGLRQYTCNVQGFGVDTQDILQRLHTIIDSPTIVREFKSDGDIAIVNRGSVSDISIKLETGFERRYSLDIIFNTSHSEDIELTTIESIEISGKIKKADQIEKTVGPFTVPSPLP